MLSQDEKTRPKWAGQLNSPPGQAISSASSAANKPVYVLTENDPQRMIRTIGLGADGLITDRPALARQVLTRHAAMTQAEHFENHQLARRLALMLMRR